MLQALGFVEECNEFLLDLGITKKANKIKKWVKKAIHRVKIMKEEKEAEDYVDQIENE